jgi:hypothetical protein
LSFTSGRDADLLEVVDALGSVGGKVGVVNENAE